MVEEYMFNDEEHLGTFGHVWARLGTFRHIWACLGTFGNIWARLGMVWATIYGGATEGL
jgi:hypothetical protein